MRDNSTYDWFYLGLINMNSTSKLINNINPKAAVQAAQIFQKLLVAYCILNVIGQMHTF